MTIRDYLETSVANNPDKIFLYFKDEEISYSKLNSRVNKRANLFINSDIRKGDTVALFLPNCPEYLYCWFALSKIGAIMIPVNTGFKEREAEYILNHSEVKMVICGSEFLDIVRNIKHKCRHLKEVLSIDKTPDTDIRLVSDLAEGLPDQLPEIELSGEDIASMLYTSGTTGPPKGCPLPNGYYTLTGKNWIDFCSIQSSERLMTFLPLFHMAAQTTTTMAALISGASLVLIERFSASKIWDQVRRYKPGIFSYIGALLSMLENQPESPKDRSHSISRIFGGGAGKEQIERFEKRFGLTVIEGYGSTEDGLVLANSYKNGSRKIGSVGRPCPGYEVRIVDRNDKPLHPGQVGEIVVKGKLMMKGYFKDPTATTEAMKGGWFHTGDNGYMESDGYFYFCERIKDIIRRSGENISAVEVEEVIRSHPKVLDVAVVAVADSIRGEEVKAHVRLKPSESKSTVPFEEIISHCNQRLAYFKVPRYVEYHKKDFPRTQTNRVKKHELKQKERQGSNDYYDRSGAESKLGKAKGQSTRT